MPKYKIADIVFEAELIYEFSQKLAKSYEYTGDSPVEFKVKITEADIEFERGKVSEFPPQYLEFLSLYRKLCDYAIKNSNAILLHSSAVAVDGNAYLFTAPSGTGKSTHTRLWRELLGDRAVMVNDDKPMVRYIDGDFYVYGTPWNGKHRLDNNVRAKVKAICLLCRGEKNSIVKISPQQMLIAILNQTIRPEDEGDMDKLLCFLDKMLKEVDLYKLNCNISLEAASLSYKTMSGDDYEN